VRSPNPSSGLALEDIVKVAQLCQPSADSSSCATKARFRQWLHARKCQRKFLTPATFARDASGAEQYLERKFDVHDRPETIEEKNRRRLF